MTSPLNLSPASGGNVASAKRSDNGGALRRGLPPSAKRASRGSPLSPRGEGWERHERPQRPHPQGCAGGSEARRFSAVELTQAHVEAIAAARGAQRLCPRDAGEGAGDGQGLRRAAAPRRARVRWTARRWASRTCSAPRACARPPARRSSATSCPTYESHRHRQSLARRGGDARQAQHGRVRHGLVQRDLGLRAGGEPLALDAAATPS